MSILRDFKTRQWIYGIATAILVLLGGYGVFNAQEQESITQLLVAILNLGGAATTVMAGRNSRPSQIDDVKQVEHAVEEAVEELDDEEYTG